MVDPIDIEAVGCRNKSVNSTFQKMSYSYRVRYLIVIVTKNVHQANDVHNKGYVVKSGMFTVKIRHGISVMFNKFRHHLTLYSIGRHIL